MIQEDEISKNFPARGRRKKWTGWRPKTDEQKIEFQKEVMESRDEKLEENLGTIRKTLRDAAGKVAHSTKNERAKLSSNHQRLWEYVKRPLQDAQKWSRAECSRNKRGKQERNTWLSAVWHQEAGKYGESHCQNCMSTGSSRKTEKSGKENCRGTLRMCPLIRRRQGKHRKK